MSLGVSFFLGRDRRHEAGITKGNRTSLITHLLLAKTALSQRRDLPDILLTIKNHEVMVWSRSSLVGAKALIFNLTTPLRN
ncbi:hypothetical protein AK965_02015 [Vibrio sp. PID17_43]|nr:hypothetical protein AK965_02015 [Vibrio sp. PID17_43]